VEVQLHTLTPRVRIYRARTCTLVILVGSEILLFVGTVFVSSEPRCRERYYYYFLFSSDGAV